MAVQAADKGKRFAIVAILLVVIAGLATAGGLVLVNSSDDTAGDDAQYVVMDIASTTPVFEPRDAAGNDPFFPLQSQLVAYQEEVEAEIDEQVAVAQANAQPGETIVRPEFDVAALDEAVKTGLYGGTEENTCDPERLISFLYANPDLGEAWAKVQGIEFVEIADYIRSLDVRVLAEPVHVLNHGYDAGIGAAYEIEAVLDAGTAVLVDEDGNVRTRCYCGNPIKPKPPEHMPPRCLVFGSLVYAQPAGSDRRNDVPSDVLLTGRQTVVGGGTWIEVKWGADDSQVGWTQAHNLRTSYCPTPTSDRFCPGPGATNVWHTPDTTTPVGQVTGEVRTHDDTLDIFAPINPVGGIGNETIVNDFMLIRFTEGTPSVQNSAWVNLADLNQDSTECFRIRQCVDTDGPVRERAGGGGIVAADGVQWVEFTGHFIGDPIVTFAEVRVNDGTGDYGWISNFYSPLPDADCEPPVYDCIEQGYLYVASDTNAADPLGLMVNLDVSIIGGPENGRVQVHIDAPTGPTGWVDTAAFYDGHSNCDHEPFCASTSATAWTEFSTDGVSRAADATPTMIAYNGALVEDGGISYLWIDIAGTDYWIDNSKVHELPAEDCLPDVPECTTIMRGPLDDVTPTLRDVATLDLATESRVMQPEDDDRLPTRDMCCVDGLYNSTDVTDIAADAVPRWVVVVGTHDVDGETWFEAPGPRFFRPADVVDASECERPECPEGTTVPGQDEIYDNLSESDLETFTGRVLVIGDDRPQPTDPETPVGAECCVSQLFTAQGLGMLPMPDGPVFVEIASGPHGIAPSWYQTTDGEWFPDTAVLDAENCQHDVDCPTDTDDSDRYDEVFDDLIDETSTDAVLLAIVLDDLGGQPSTWCCVSGDVYDDIDGDVKGALGEPTLVIVVQISEDGEWAEIIIDGPLGDGWVRTGQFLDKEDCRPDDGECPDESVVDRVTLGATALEVCCVSFETATDSGFKTVILTGETREGEDGLEYETTDGEWIPEGAFADAGRCLPTGNCPEFSVINVEALAAGDIEICCAAIGNGFEAVGLTGESRLDDNGDVELERNDGTWIPIDDFVGADRCQETPCDGTFDAGDECCEQPNEVVQGKCVPPCDNGQVRNDNGICEPPGVSCPDGSVASSVSACPCPSGQQPNDNGVCVDPGVTCADGSTAASAGACPCPAGQQRNANGVCVNPGVTCADGSVAASVAGCEPEGCPDRDDDGVCDADDNCADVANSNQSDTDGDGDGNLCDPCTDADGDLFCELGPGELNNDNCWGLYNPDQSDADGDGVGNDCDNCPRISNADQANGDGLGTGDACEQPACAEGDADGDGVCNDDDNCVTVANPGQSDRDDRDGYGDACDNCPDAYNPDQADTYGDSRGDACEVAPCSAGDDDSDGICNDQDNCSSISNANQANRDGDGFGDACDLCPSTQSSGADSDGDGFGNECDFCPGPNGPVDASDIANRDQGFLYDTDGDGIKDSCFAPLI